MTRAADVVLLAIETAGSGCSAAVMCGRQVLAVEARPLRHGHAEALLPMIDRVMTEAKLAPQELHAVAVAIGPGGFTGIRVGLAAAQGIALAAGADLIGISNFTATAAAFAGNADRANRVLLVALDSRRADLYVQLFAPVDADGVLTPLAAPAAILPEQLGGYAAELSARPELSTRIGADQPLLIAGDAAEAAAAALKGRARFDVAKQSAPDALGVAAAALHQLQGGPPSPPVRPLYLRPPDVTLPKRPVSRSFFAS